MKCFILVALVSCVSAGIGYDGGSGGSGAAYGGSSGGGGGYGSTETKCTPYYDTIESDHCEAYTERVCTTTQKEHCKDIADQTCNGVVSSKQVRKCFDVNEERCVLKENVQFETIEIPFVVQKCSVVSERVCDTVYETSSSAREDVQCIEVVNPKCIIKDNTVHDVTCRTTTTFDCDTSGYGDNGANAAGSGNEGDNSYGYPGSAVSAASGYAANNAGSGYANAAGGSSGAYSSVTGYGTPQPNCRRKQDTKCYKTPRTVSTQTCVSSSEKVCEKLVLSVPSVSPRQSCRNEQKKVCDLEERTQPKQVQRYTYEKECQAVPRQVCENADEKTLVPSCVPITRKECTYTPIENCVDEPKKHCFKISSQVRKEKCETYPVAGGYGQQEQSGSGAAVSYPDRY